MIDEGLPVVIGSAALLGALMKLSHWLATTYVRKMDGKVRFRESKDAPTRTRGGGQKGNRGRRRSGGDGNMF